LSVRSLVAARAAYATLFGAVGASFPYLPVFYREQGLSLGQVGLLGALAAAVALLTAPLWGTLADRYPTSRIVIPIAALLTGVAAALLAAAHQPIAIGASAVAMSASLAGIPPLIDARTLQMVRGDNDRYGRIRVWGSISFVVAAWGTGFLVERAGIASLFTVYVPLLVATAAVGLFVRGHGRVTPPLPRLAGIGLVLRKGVLRRFLIAALVVWSASMAINGFFSIHLVAIGAPGELVGSAWALGAIVEVPIMWAYPSLSARFGARRLLIAGSGAFALRAIALLVFTHPVAAAATMLLHGVGFGLLLVGGVTHVSRYAPREAAATAQGILSSTVFSLSMVVGPGLGGLVAATWGLPALFALAAAVGVGGMALMAIAVADPDRPTGGYDRADAAPDLSAADQPPPPAPVRR
jgi:MFS transporter, PPP family, 3-phenylpropionic acid transporter